MENSVKSISSTYGIYLGIILSLFTVVAYVVDLSLLTKFWFGILSMIVLIIVAIIAVRSTKKQYSGIFSFKNAFTAYFITILIGMSISTLVSILIFNFVDPQSADTVKELTIDASRQMMENFGATESEINEALSKMEDSNQLSIINLLKSFVFSLAFLSLIGLIIALIFREKEPIN